jgi:hypothetical protein
MSKVKLNDLLPNIDNAGRRLVLSEIMGQPKAYTLPRRRRPKPMSSSPSSDSTTNELK